MLLVFVRCNVVCFFLRCFVFLVVLVFAVVAFSAPCFALPVDFDPSCEEQFEPSCAYIARIFCRHEHAPEPCG